MIALITLAAVLAVALSLALAQVDFWKGGAEEWQRLHGMNEKIWRKRFAKMHRRAQREERAARVAAGVARDEAWLRAHAEYMSVRGWKVARFWCDRYRAENDGERHIAALKDVRAQVPWEARKPYTQAVERAVRRLTP